MHFKSLHFHSFIHILYADVYHCIALVFDGDCCLFLVIIIIIHSLVAISRSLGQIGRK